MGKGSSGGGQTTAYQTNIPEWSEGAHRTLVSEAENFVYDPELGGYVGYDPAERIQGFSPQENQAFSAVQQMFDRGDPYADFAGQQIERAGAIPDRFGDIASAYQSRNFDFGRSDPRFDFGRVGSSYDPSTFDFGTYGGPRYSARDFDFGQVDSTYDPSSFDFGRFTDEGVAESYMSPYMRNVLEGEKAAARKEFELQGMRSDAERVASGSRGGYREAVQQAIERPEQARQISEIEARGLQRAYEDAGARFEADRQAAIHAARMGDQSALQAAQMRMRASEGDRSAAIQAAQMGDLSRLQEAQMGLDIFGGDQAAAIQAAQMGEAGAVRAAEMRQRAGEGDRTAAIKAAQMNQEAWDRNRQAAIRAAEMGDASSVRAAQMRMEADRFNQQNLARQMDALQGLSRSAMDIGAAGQARALERQGALREAGETQRGMGQALRDLDYSDFVAQRDWPWQQMGRLQSIISGIPANMQNTQYGRGPSIPSELLGLGLGGYAMQNLLK